MGSSKIEAQGQSQGHVTSAFMCFFKERKSIQSSLATRIAWFGI